MKHKFSLMWRVAVALVLVLSFSLVAAVPASAAGLLTNVTATPKKATAEATTTYTIGFTTATTYDVEKVVMAFNSAFDVSSVAGKTATVSGIGAGTLGVSGKVVTYTLDTPEVIGDGTAITIAFGGVKNPSLPAIYSPGVTVTTQKGATVIDTGIADVTITPKPVKNINTGETFTSIQEAIDDAQTLAGHTITVAAGTYTQSSTLTIYKARLTLQSTDGAASTIISSSTAGVMLDIGSAVPRTPDVTIDGFTFKGAGDGATAQIGIYCYGNGFTIRNNKFIDIAKGANILVDSALVAMTSGAIDKNTFIGEGANAAQGISVGGPKDVSGVTISNNTLSNFDASDAILVCNPTVSDVTVTENTVTDSGNGLCLTGPGDGIDVTDNTFSGCKRGVKISAWGGALAPTNLTITGNDITGNTEDGILIECWDTTNAINNNNIYGNTDYGINNTTTTSVDAEDNWWGVAVESAIDSMVYGDVDFSPWLLPDGTSTTDDLTIVSLYEGWNLISLSLIPDDSDITKVISDDTLASGDVSSVSLVRGYDPAAGTFPRYEPDVGGDLTTMEDGYGYWVFMVAADTLIVAGKVMPDPPATPPTYPVVVGWNLIGLKSAVDMSDVDNLATPTTGYLLNIAGTYPVLWSYDAEAGKYTNVRGVTGGMEVGHGFWLWAEEEGTIVPPG